MRKKIIEVSWIFWAHPLKNIIAPARIQHQPIPTTKHTELRRHRVLFSFISFWRRNFWWNETHKWKELLFVSYIGNMHISHIYIYILYIPYQYVFCEWLRMIFKAWMSGHFLESSLLANPWGYQQLVLTRWIRKFTQACHGISTCNNHHQKLPKSAGNSQLSVNIYDLVSDWSKKMVWNLLPLATKKQQHYTSTKGTRHFEVQCHDLQRLSGALPAQEIRKWCSTSSPQWSYRDHLELLNASEH